MTLGFLRVESGRSPLFRFAATADIDGGERGLAIIRLRQISFGSQVKLIFLLALLTAFAFFALFFGLQLADRPVGGGDADSIPMLAAVALILAAVIAAIQIGGLAVLRLLPWQGPSLKVEGGDHLWRVFE